MTSLIAFFALSFGLTVALVPLARGIAARRGWLVARPVADRWHRRPVSKVGGIVMLAALAPIAFATADGSGLGALLLLSGLMFAIGLCDDLRPIRPAMKMAAQSAAALAFLFVVPPIELTSMTWLNTALSCLWIVSITNAFNMLDNIDGLAAAVAGIVGIFALVGPMSGEPTAVAFGLASLTGAAAGFLAHNWHPATVFMGDSGSHLLGSFIAGATLLSVPAVGEPGRIAPFVVLLLVPIADLVVVSITRGLAGRSPLYGGIDHLSHRLVALGLGDRGAVILLSVLTIGGGLIAVAMGRATPGVAWSLAGGYAALVAAAALFAARVKTVRRPASAPQSAGTSARVRPGASMPASTRAHARRPNPVL